MGVRRPGGGGNGKRLHGRVTSWRPRTARCGAGGHKLIPKADSRSCMGARVAIPRFFSPSPDGGQSGSVFPTNGSNPRFPPWQVGAGLARISAVSPKMVAWPAFEPALGLDISASRTDGPCGRRGPGRGGLIALAKAENRQDSGMISAGTDVVDGCVVRQPKAYPVYERGLPRPPHWR